jgi:hypothetical protein
MELHHRENFNTEINYGTLNIYTSYFPENLIRAYQTTRWHIPEDNSMNLHNGEIIILNIYPEDGGSTFFRNYTTFTSPDRCGILKSNRSAILFEVTNTTPIPLRSSVADREVGEGRGGVGGGGQAALGARTSFGELRALLHTCHTGATRVTSLPLLLPRRWGFRPVVEQATRSTFSAWGGDLPRDQGTKADRYPKTSRKPRRTPEIWI